MSGFEFPYIFIGIENTPIALTNNKKTESDTTCVAKKRSKRQRVWKRRLRCQCSINWNFQVKHRKSAWTTNVFMWYICISISVERNGLLFYIWQQKNDGKRIEKNAARADADAFYLSLGKNSIFELFWFVVPFAVSEQFSHHNRKHYFQCINKNEFIAKSKLSLSTIARTANRKRKKCAYTYSKVEFNNARFIPNAFSCQFMCFCVARKSALPHEYLLFSICYEMQIYIRQKERRDRT